MKCLKEFQAENVAASSSSSHHELNPNQAVCQKPVPGTEFPHISLTELKSTNVQTSEAEPRWIVVATSVLWCSFMKYFCYLGQKKSFDHICYHRYKQQTKFLPVLFLYLSFPLCLLPRVIQEQTSVQHISKQPVCGGSFVLLSQQEGWWESTGVGGRLRLHSSTLTEGRSLLRPHRLLVQ